MPKQNAKAKAPALFSRESLGITQPESTPAPEAPAQGLAVAIGKTESVVRVDWDSLPENSRAFIIMYGLRQWLNDAHASIKPTTFKDKAALHKAVDEVIQARLGKLTSGDIEARTRGAGGVFGAKALTAALAALAHSRTGCGEGAALIAINKAGYENALLAFAKKAGVDEATARGMVQEKAAALAGELAADVGGLF